MTAWTLVDSPVDELLLITDGEALTTIWFSPHKGLDRSQPADSRDDDHSVLVAARRQLGEYFAGERRTFDLPLAPRGTDFQLAVWLRLREIPYGETRTYGQIAAELGHSPAASRAVGLANGSNPLSIVVPCHRVIGADGSLTGFGGGLARKRYLLDRESDLLF